MADALVEDFITKLKRRQVEGSLVTARKTALVLRQVIAAERKPAPYLASQLIELVKNYGRKLIAANPTELAIGNIVRRVLHIIREEDVTSSSHSAANADDDLGQAGPAGGGIAASAGNRTALLAPALKNLLEPTPQVKKPASDTGSVGESESRRQNDKPKSDRASWRLKHNVIEGINELITEVENFSSLIAEQALEHIHQNEVILTMGRSKTLLNFLSEAKKKRSFQAVVAEGAPRYDGHLLAKELAALGVQTTAITDAAVFAMMARVNMVVVGAHAVMANGGVLAPVGLHMAALAAKRHAVPFVVLCGLHKLSPVFPHDPDTLLNDFKSPSGVLDFGEISDCLDSAAGRVHTPNPFFDYIPPELVSLFITDGGGHNPSYVYRLIAEFYSPEDYVL